MVTQGHSLLPPPLPQGMKRTIQCLQEQLQLVTMEAQEDFSHLSTTSRSLQEPTKDLQEKISRSVTFFLFSAFTLPASCHVALMLVLALQRLQLCGAPGFAPG